MNLNKVLNIRCLLVRALSVFICLNFIVSASVFAGEFIERERQIWQESGIGLDRLSELISDEECISGAIELRGCIEAIKSLGQWAQVPSVIQLTAVMAEVQPTLQPLTEVGPFSVYSALEIQQLSAQLDLAESVQLARAQSEREKILVQEFIQHTLEEVKAEQDRILEAMKAEQDQPSEEVKVEQDQQPVFSFSQLFIEIARQTLPSPDHEAMAVGQALSVATRWFRRDPHFDLVAWEVRQLRMRAGGRSVVGIGVEIAPDPGGVLVRAVWEGGPALEAGIQPGDLIITVDGQSTRGINLHETVTMVTGEANTQVEITLLRGEEEIPLVLTRRRVVLANVTSKLLPQSEDETVGYIKIRNFSDENLCQNVSIILSEFNRSLVSSIIVDLRDNPGGLLTQAVCLSGLFIGRKEVVKVRSPGDIRFRSMRSSQDAETELPLMVLTNARSASASEVFSAAIQDHQRGVVFGYRTFGKGSVQGGYGTNFDGIVEFSTIESFYSPLFRPILGVGLEPDLKATTEEEAFVQRYMDVFGEFYADQLSPARTSQGQVRANLPLQACSGSQGGQKQIENLALLEDASQDPPSGVVQDSTASGQVFEDPVLEEALRLASCLTL